MSDYAMFTPEGNELVTNVVDAANKMTSDLNATMEDVAAFALHNLQKLSVSGYPEATDTYVRDLVLEAIGFFPKKA